MRGATAATGSNDPWAHVWTRAWQISATSTGPGDRQLIAELGDIARDTGAPSMSALHNYYVGQSLLHARKPEAALEHFSLALNTTDQVGDDLHGGGALLGIVLSTLALDADNTEEVCRLALQRLHDRRSWYFVTMVLGLIAQRCLTHDQPRLAHTIHGHLLTHTGSVLTSRGRRTDAPTFDDAAEQWHREGALLGREDVIALTTANLQGPPNRRGGTPPPKVQHRQHPNDAPADSADRPETQECDRMRKLGCAQNWLIAVPVRR